MTRPFVLLLMFCLGAAAQSDFDIRTGLFRGVPVSYRVVNGLAVTEGDIVLGPADELAAPKPVDSRSSTIISPQQFRWPNGAIPYMIDSDIPTPQRVNDAIAYWNGNTPITLSPRVGQANWLHFVRENNNGVCFSSIGMVGGEQRIRVDDACVASGLIHEIGHTVGLRHEQARIDRDRYVRVSTENVIKTLVGNFNQAIISSADVGPYDFNSIMHYSRFSDSRNLYVPTIETIPPGMPIGVSVALSAQELNVVKGMYGQPVTSTLVTSNPPGLELIVDGVTITTPVAFDWPEGSNHTLEAQTQGVDAIRYVPGRWSDDGTLAHSITATPGITTYSASFIQQFLVKAAAPGNGTVTIDPPSDDGFYPTGATLFITAIPAEGQSFQRWTGFINTIHGGSANPAKIRLNFSGANYTANFLSHQPSTVTTDPPGLTITVDGTNYLSPRSFDWAAGSTHKIGVATLIAGQVGVRNAFQNWNDGGDATHDVVVPGDGQLTYTAGFQTQYELFTAISGTGTGTINVSPSAADGYYNAGASVQLTAVPATGAAFANWLVDLTGNSPTRTLQMREAETVAANFNRPQTLGFNAIVNAATLQTGNVSPGLELTIFGSGLGPAEGVAFTPDASGKAPKTLGGIRVLFDGMPAPVLFASSKQVKTVVPYSVDGQPSTGVQLEVNGVRSGMVTLAVLDTTPSIFTADESGSGLMQASNEDGSPNAEANPAIGGSVVSFLATGAGQMNPAVADGQIGTSPLSVPALPVRVEIAGQDAEVISGAGADGQVAGVLRISARVPAGIAPGAAAVRVFFGYSPSPAGTVVFVQ